jgi:hypothetical protein
MKNKLLGIFLVIAFFAKAQNYYDDAQGRFSLYLEKKINKKLFIHLEQQDRWDQNLSRFYRASLDFGVSYKVTPNIKIEADYVYIQRKKKDDSFTPRHWTSVGLILKKDIRRFKFLYRNMFQARFKEWGSAADAAIWHYYDRNKLTVKYEITKRVDVYVAEEIYIPVNSPAVKGPDRSRTIFGTDIKTFRNQELELYFMYQVQLQKNNWYDVSDRYQYPFLNRYFIYGISYNISF